MITNKKPIIIYFLSYLHGFQKTRVIGQIGYLYRSQSVNEINIHVCSVCCNNESPAPIIVVATVYLSLD